MSYQGCRCQRQPSTGMELGREAASGRGELCEENKKHTNYEGS